jgi:hypothetical protein
LVWTTTLKHGKGGQFVAQVKALPGNPYDGHTLATVIPDMEALVGNAIARILADKGYRAHSGPVALSDPDAESDRAGTTKQSGWSLLVSVLSIWIYSCCLQK